MELNDYIKLYLPNFQHNVNILNEQSSIIPSELV